MFIPHLITFTFTILLYELGRSDKEEVLRVCVWLGLDCPGSQGAVGAVTAKCDVHRISKGDKEDFS